MFMIDITKVRPLTPRRLQLEFADGLQAVVDLDQVIGQYKGVLLPLLDADYFRQVTLNQELGTIVWPNGADLCPDVLYSFASGIPIMVNGRVRKRCQEPFVRRRSEDGDRKAEH